MKKLLLLIFFSVIYPQSGDNKNLFPSSESILDSLARNYDRIDDYYVEIEVSIKTPMLRMPRKKVEFWYKKPNLTKAEAKGFAAIPKSGLVSSPVDLFDNLKNVQVVGAEYFNKQQVWILRGELIPDSLTFKHLTDKTSNLELSMRLYIDRSNWILLRSETWMDTLQILEIESDYKNVKNGIYLPKTTMINFEYSKDLKEEIENSIPSNNQVVNMKKDMVLNSEMADNLDKQKMSGYITLNFSNYKVNQGLSKDFFMPDSIKQQKK